MIERSMEMSSWRTSERLTMVNSKAVATRDTPVTLFYYRSFCGEPSYGLR